MVTDPDHQPHQREGGKGHDKTEVNPAARRDRPGANPPREGMRNHGDEQVPATQEEPLDPLGPGGIGS